MTKTNTYPLRVRIEAAAFMTLSLTFSSMVTQQYMPTLLQAQAIHANTQTLESQFSPLVLRQARKLRKRLDTKSGFPPALVSLANALEERRELLKKSITVDFNEVVRSGAHPSFPESWEIRLEHHPSWLTLKTDGRVEYIVDTEQIAAFLAATPPEQIKAPVSRTVTSVQTHHMDKELLEVATDGPTEPGYIFNSREIASAIADGLDGNQTRVTVSVIRDNGHISLSLEDGSHYTLERISAGRSNFEYSPWGRKANIRKGLDERLDGILLAPGQSMSFNDAIGPMSAWRGWKESLAIFDGWKLEPIVGGGICQVATTIYRAALLAGLKVEERKSHSLYVSYYESYGVGLDATVFPGKQDFILTNDTPGHILVESYTEGDDGYVNFYGMPDGRSVALEGPYFRDTAPDNVRISDRYGDNRRLHSNEIAWIQRITYRDGTEKENHIFSKYNKGIPRKIISDYGELADHGTELLRSAASSVAEDLN